MDTSFRPSLLSDAARARWLSPSLAAALHGLVAVTVMVGLTFDPPRPDLGPNIVVELVPMAAPEPPPLPAPPTPAPAPAPAAPPAPKIVPKIVPKAAAPLRPSRPTPKAPVPDLASPAVPEPAAAAPAAAASEPAAGTPAAGAVPSPQPGPVQEAYVPPLGRAGYLSNPKPHYPSLARKRGWEGTVTLLVEVDATGTPVSVEVKDSSGHSVLDHCAVAAVRQWRFKPAQRGGQTVAASVEVPVRFDLKDENLAG